MWNMQFDTEKLIGAVRVREALWKKSSILYTDKLLKHRLWEEVAKEIYPLWDTYEVRDRIRIDSDIQKKWRNIRDAFVKELRSQRNEASVRKKRKYIYFDSLEFLLQELRPRSSDGHSRSEQEMLVAEDTDYSNMRFGLDDKDYSFLVHTAERSVNEDDDTVQISAEEGNYFGTISKTTEEAHTEVQTEAQITGPGETFSNTQGDAHYNQMMPGGTRRANTKKSYERRPGLRKSQINSLLRRKSEKERKREKATKSIEATLLQLLREKSKHSRECDEDHSFFNSLIPSVKKLIARQKLLFRIEVLKAMDKVQCMNMERRDNFIPEQHLQSKNSKSKEREFLQVESSIAST